MEKLRFFALGGLDENGKNSYVLEVDDEIYLLDCGLRYPVNKGLLGVEYIIPDFSYLINNRSRIKAVFITNGHDNTMAALPYLVKEIPEIKIYATALNERLIQKEFKKFDIRKRVNLIDRNQNFKIEQRSFKTFPLLQALADSYGLAIDTKQGQIVYVSDFIFDFDLLNNSFMGDVNKISQIGDKGVFMLLCESIGSTTPGFTSPRHKIHNQLEFELENSPKRLFIVMEKDNLYRSLEVLDLAAQFKRPVYFHNPKHLAFIETVSNLGYYKPKCRILKEKEFHNNINNAIIIVSSSGPKIFNNMHSIAIGEDEKVFTKASDSVFIAYPTVPGSEKAASAMENDLYKAHVRFSKVHLGETLGFHASSEDLKMMLFMTRPKYYIPLKGDYRQLMDNAKLAHNAGLGLDKIILLDNGQVAYFENNRLKSTKEKITLVDKMIDGIESLDSTGMVLKDRLSMSTDGVMVLGILINKKTKQIIAGPDIQTRGLFYLKDSEYVITNIARILNESIAEHAKKAKFDNTKLRLELREKIAKYVLKEVGKKPMILISILELANG